jgi:hypothetical protein
VAFSPLPTTWFGRARPFGPGEGARRRGPFSAAEGGAAVDPVEPRLDPAATEDARVCRVREGAMMTALGLRWAVAAPRWAGDGDMDGVRRGLVMLPAAGADLLLGRLVRPRAGLGGGPATPGWLVGGMSWRPWLRWWRWLPGSSLAAGRCRFG